jgi:hypothetical protein
MKSKEYARALGTDRARKTQKPYIIYQVRNSQWMVDPYTDEHHTKHGPYKNFEIIQPRCPKCGQVVCVVTCENAP